MDTCYMCKGDLEPVDHLLLHGQIAKALRKFAFNCLGIFLGYF